MPPATAPPGTDDVYYVIPVPDRDAIDYLELESVLYEAMSQGAIAEVIVTAHTDSMGDSVENMALSQRWADDLRLWIASRGVPLSVIKAEGLGDSRPLENVPDETPSRINQRITVEIIFAR